MPPPAPTAATLRAPWTSHISANLLLIAPRAAAAILGSSSGSGGEQVTGEYLGSGGIDDGWFATRDRGRLDDHGDVSDCAVVGTEDEEWGPRIAAAVVLVEGANATPEALRTFARAHLRGSKTPDVIVLIEELPYTDTGKLLRRVVREELGRDTTAPAAR